MTLSPCIPTPRPVKRRFARTMVTQTSLFLISLAPVFYNPARIRSGNKLKHAADISPAGRDQELLLPALFVMLRPVILFALENVSHSQSKTDQ